MPAIPLASGLRTMLKLPVGHILSGEFIFGLNLVSTLFLPLLKFAVPHRIPLLILFFSGPLLLLFVAWCFEPVRDLVFYVKLYTLTMGVSLLSLSILFRLCDPRQHLFKVYTFLILSLLLSLSVIPLTPALTAMDPFWGVLPGPFSLDPVIHLDVFFARGIVWILTVLVILVVGLSRPLGPSVWLAFFVILGLLSWVQPLPMTPRLRFESLFVEQTASERFQIFKEQASSSPWPLRSWIDEFEFLESQILSELPPGIVTTAPQKLSIFLYQTPNSKRRLIGAEDVQVGNFVRGEMHLSHVELGDDILKHELVHLLQPQMRAPLKAYLDPFVFEGLAVALSDDKNRVHPQAAALIQEISATRPFEWPRGIRFYSATSAAVAYLIAGGYAHEALRQNRMPWNAEIAVTPFLTMPVSETHRQRARELLKRRSLIEDPLMRDCEREYRLFLDNRSTSAWRRLVPLCRNSYRPYHALWSLNLSREFALNLLTASPTVEDLVRGDLAVLSDQLPTAAHHYARSPLAEAKLKLDVLASKDALRLKSILQSSSDPGDDIHRLQSIIRNPAWTESWIRSQPILKRHALTRLVLNVRPLT